MKPVIISSHSSHQDLLTYGPSLLDKLIKDFGAVTYDHLQPDFSDIPELFNDEEKLVLFNHFATPRGFHDFTQHLPRFKQVKYVLSPYSAYEGLDLELVKNMGIRYRNNGGANAKSVAQYAIMAMFMLLSKYPVLGRGSKWPDGSVLGEERFGKKVGIIGMGNVGLEIYDTVHKLGMEAVYCNRTAADLSAPQVSLAEVAHQDIIFVTIATNPETVTFLKDFHTMLQPHQYVIDISATDTLYDKLAVAKLVETGQLQGYALELDDPSFLTPAPTVNIVATPHMAWCTVDAERRTVENYLQRALQILEGHADQVDFIV